ncbi:hypothetical protein Plim_4011 [Planctopirus limnophila DSM 3776]|uniref:Uncharacterized protein n=1 Tax=Planctopirus limnophila (strain ATCC 43296 / DSM 3776 / IFAM 1008 / Mu 290) TaxID=521674 RepID=D5SY29_PLAL2|nr:hypothetical protein Plim_4011 [Planctopirus limnophila DSM 3776]
MRFTLVQGVVSWRLLIDTSWLRRKHVQNRQARSWSMCESEVGALLASQQWHTMKKGKNGSFTPVVQSRGRSGVGSKDC